MAEYIEREALLARIKELQCTDPSQIGKKQFADGYLVGLDESEIILRQAPAADVVEVVHGRWKYYHKQGKAVCMNCSFERNLDYSFGAAVACPNCGARMGGE